MRRSSSHSHVGATEPPAKGRTPHSALQSWPRRALQWAEHLAVLWVVISIGAAAWPLLFARPDVLPRVDAATLGAVAGRTYEVQLALLNASAGVTASVHLDSPDPAIQFDPDAAEIAPRDRSIIRIKGRAADVGALSLPVRMVSKAGVLHPSHEGRVDLPLAVWPAERFGRFVVLAARLGWAAFRATLELGGAAPKGLACRAQMTGADADFTGAAPAVSYDQPVPATVGSRSGAGIEWSMAAVGAFQSVDVYVFAKVRPGVSDPLWPAIASGIEWRCDRK